MDLESELRQAMAEQVAEAEATPTLVTDVRRRYRRRQTRIRVGVGVAAAAVAVAAIAPGYHSFRASTVGANGEQNGKGGSSASPAPGQDPGTGLPEAPVAPGQSAPGAVPSEPSGGGAAPPDSKPSGGAVGPIRLPAWVTFLPPGLAAEAPCGTKNDDGTQVTTCRFRGADGSAEIRVLRGTGVRGPEDLVSSSAVPKTASVRGLRALLVERPGGKAQIGWLAEPGVGVIVVVEGASVREQLMRIAEGIRL